MTVGILALQGAFQKHADALESLNCSYRFVKKPSDLEGLRGLILPGGESTVMSCLLRENNLFDSILNFSHKHSLFGTCAGIILMAKKVNSEKVLNFGLLDIEIQRNAYGYQVDSFDHEVFINFLNEPITVPFIRAPKIEKILSPDVKVLGNLKGVPVLIKEGLHMAATFHPELTSNLSIHRYFLDSL
jgi:5'-phosphate synthase pdxT subunit